MAEDTYEVVGVEALDRVWFVVRVKGLDKPIKLHRNWFVRRGGLVASKNSVTQVLIKPGGRVRFRISKLNPHMDKDHVFVEGFEVVKE